MLAKLMSYFLLGLIRVLTGSQARWHGCPPKAEQRIYFANHQSHADLVMIWAALPQELRSVTRDEDPLEPLLDALSNGDSIILFPEGTRGHAELPQPFKAGLYNLALKCPGAVLVPAWINNVQHVLPKGEVVPVPVLCSVTFGAPLQVQEGEACRAFLDRARDAVIALRDV